MTEGFEREALNINDETILYNLLYKFFTKSMKIEYYASANIQAIYFLIPSTSGGKKVVIKHTVKELQAIASKNNIKITKKVDGKTVRLNKQGLIAKLKRYKFL